MDNALFSRLYQEQLISETEFKDIERHSPVMQVFGELRLLLYLGIVLFSTAIGILIYRYIDTIGHDVLLMSIALVCAACFLFCFRKSKGFLRGKQTSPGFLFDYVLLLACLLLLTFIGYIQFQYNLFGDHWGMALFIPMLVLFGAAYYFDHIGVLSLAITNLAAWVGITVTPSRMLKANDFGSPTTIYTAVLLGIGLISLSFFSSYRNIKAHFSFTYKNFGLHLVFIALIAGLLRFESYYAIWFTVLAIFSFLAFRYALKERSFYFLVVTALYGWIALSCMVVRQLTYGGEIGSVYAIFIYFILSGIGFIRLLMHYNKVLKQYAPL